jgi:hypothetical protein
MLLKLTGSLVGVQEGLRGRLPWPFEPIYRIAIPAKKSTHELLTRKAEDSDESDHEEQEAEQLQHRATV